MTSEQMTPVRLTPEQIDEIIAKMPTPKMVKCIETPILEKRNRQVREQLEKVKLIPSGYEKFKEMIYDIYNRSVAKHGTMAGVIAAQTVVSQLTQSTLNTFHLAGTGSSIVETGVKRVDELLNGNQKPSSDACVIYPRIPSFSEDELLQNTMHRLKNVSMKHLVYSSKTECLEKGDPKVEFVYTTMTGIDLTMSSPNNSNGFSGIVKFVFNPQRLFQEKVTPADVAQRLMDIYPSILAVPTSMEAPMLYVYLTIDEIALSKTYSRFAMKTITRTCLYGIPEIRNIRVRVNSEGMYFYYAAGTNLYELAKLDCVDFSRCYSNNTREMIDVFGIAAAKKFLYEEFLRIFESDGMYSHPGHIKILFDQMLSIGKFASVSRFGMKMGEFGPVACIAFENPRKATCDAAFTNAHDPLTGTSAILVGKTMKGGTGQSHAYLDLQHYGIQIGEVLDNQLFEDDAVNDDIPEPSKVDAPSKVDVPSKVDAPVYKPTEKKKAVFL